MLANLLNPFDSFWTFCAFTAIFIVLTTVYRFVSHKYNYWSRFGVAGPTPLPLIGTFYQIFWRPFCEVAEANQNKYGKIYGTYVGFQPIINIADPELVKQITIKDFNKFVNRRRAITNNPSIDRSVLMVENDDWKQMRSVISPAFSSSKMRKMHQLVEDCVDDLEKFLQKSAESKTEVQMKKATGNYTMQAIASCAFATRIDTHNDPDNPFIAHVLQLFKPRPLRFIFILLALPFLKFIKISLVDTKITDFFKKATQKILERRTNENTKHHDFLQLMIEAQKKGKIEGEQTDEKEELEHHHGQGGEVHVEQAKNKAFQIGEDEIMANAFIFFIAGYETTATLLLKIEAFGRPVLLLGDPDLIKQVMVKDFHVFQNRRSFTNDVPVSEILIKNLFSAEDDFWKRLRAIVSPTFTSGKMKKMRPLIRECIQFCMDNLETHACHHKEVDLHDVFGCLTMDVIAKCAFGTDTNANADRNNPFVVNAKEVITGNLTTFLKIVLLPKFILWRMKIKIFAGRDDNNKFFIDITRAIIKNRQSKNIKINDFLQLLMDCQVDDAKEKEDVTSDNVIEDEDAIKAQEKATNINLLNKKLTEEEILGQAYIFFIAGYETTATTLSLICYELAVNQDAQEKLHQEISSAPKTGDEIDYETLVKLPFLDAVVSETLRKHPPLVRVDRKCSQRYRLPNTNVVLRPGDLIEVPIYALHHCEEFYPEPEVFRPERFLPENRHLIKPYSYLPFGTGPRNCIGMRFALLEIKLALAKIVPKFRFVPNANTDIPLKNKFRGLLIGYERLKVVVEQRK